jgi:hypothetical protein
MEAVAHAVTSDNGFLSQNRATLCQLHTSSGRNTARAAVRINTLNVPSAKAETAHKRWKTGILGFLVKLPLPDPKPSASSTHLASVSRQFGSGSAVKPQNQMGRSVTGFVATGTRALAADGGFDAASTGLTFTLL